MKSAALRSACDDYLSRIQHYAKIEELEVTRARIPEDSRVVALTERGESWSSSQLAELVGGGDGGPRRHVRIGDADACRTTCSTGRTPLEPGPLTLPHELARVVPYEQFECAPIPAERYISRILTPV